MKVEHAIFFFFLRVPLFHLDSTITFQPSIVDPGWPRCFGRAPLLLASATVLRDANEFVSQIFQEMPIYKGNIKKGVCSPALGNCLHAFCFYPFLPKFLQSTSIYQSASFKFFTPPGAQRIRVGYSGIIGRNIEMPNNDIQTSDLRNMWPLAVWETKTKSSLKPWSDQTSIHIRKRVLKNQTTNLEPVLTQVLSHPVLTYYSSTTSTGPFFIGNRKAGDRLKRPSQKLDLLGCNSCIQLSSGKTIWVDINFWIRPSW